MCFIGNNFFFSRNTLFTLSKDLMNVILFLLLRTVLHLFLKGNLIVVIFFQIKKILDRFFSRSLTPFLSTNFKLDGD